MSVLSASEYAAILRQDLVAFIERAFYELNPQATYLPASFIELMAAKLEDCRKGKIRRLVINLPPRSLKSHCVSISFPAWLLGHNPALQIICASYGQDLADKLARDCRLVMEAAWYRMLFPTRLSGRRAVNDFSTLQSGFRMATSVGGVLTGRGADIIIIDDPLKPDQALSEAGRTAVNEWYDSTLLTRLNNKVEGCIIIVMQRLHQDDLTGHVLQHGGWEVVSFPAIAEVEEHVAFATPFGLRHFRRSPGMPLHPERENLETLHAMKRAIGSFNFSGQYQQAPMPVSGNLIKREWLRYYDPTITLQRPLRVLQSWDTANKASEINDYSVCTTWAEIGDERYLLDVFRQRLNYPDLKRAILNQKRRYNADIILIEDKASGTQLIQEFRADLMHCVTPYLPPPGADKIMRLHACSDFFESGRVLLPTNAPWLDDYIAEFTGFPGTRYDDQVDSTTQALDKMREPDPLAIWRKLGSG
jgi:predicted phage terminase large subunit-like protein